MSSEADSAAATTSAAVQPHIAVIGAGISGLACAQRLVELLPGAQITVLEKAQRTGGLIGSERVNGCLLERGADSILTEKPAALRLARKLGLEEQIIATNSNDRGAYVVYQGRLERIPEGFSMMAPSQFWPIAKSPVLSLRGKLRMLAETLLPRGPGGDESVGHFVRRRFGDEVLTKLAQPLMGGIYGTDIDVLSLPATMPRFPALEAEHGSVTLGLWRRAHSNALNAKEAARGVRYGLFIAFKEGVQTLPDRLASMLGERVRLGSAALAVKPRAAQGFEITLEAGAALAVDAVVLAVPGRPMARLVEELDRTLAQHLLDIPYGSTAAVYYGFRREDVAHPLDAFGFVVPKVERRQLIAATWASVKFEGRAPAGHVLLRVFFGGDGNDEVLDLDDERLVQAGLRELEALVGVRGKPLFSHLTRHPYAMPKYTLGHLQRVRRIEQRAQRFVGLEIAGNALYGVGIPDAVQSGEAAAERLAALFGKR